MSYTDDVRENFNYLPIFGGTCGLNLIAGMKRFLKKKNLTYKLKLEPAVFSEKSDRRIKMFKKMKKQLKKKNPVIISVGPTIIGKPSKKEKVKMYAGWISESLINIKQKENEEFYDHYVTVTGILVDSQKEDTYFQISSWGKKYYVDYQDICHYVDREKTSMVCDAVFMN